MSNIQLDEEAWGLVTPDLIVPPASVITNLSPAVWYAQYGVIFNRFSLTSRKTLRYLNTYVGVASGNVEMGVVALSGAGHATFTKVMTSGLIACPAVGAVHQDLTATVLEAGDYAAFLFVDNTTATFPQVSTASLAGSRWGANWTYTSAGVPATGTLAWGQRCIPGLTLEADI